jgi:outer membrane protein TolC
LNSYYRFSFQQQLLSGFGFGPNLRYLRIAKNDKKISDIAFKDQVIATVTQIENIYWDLVSAYEQARVNEQSLAFANQTLDNAKKQLKLESIPEMDVMKAEAESSRRDQDLTVARTNLELQESLMKNALTKSLDDPTLGEMPVVPTDLMSTSSTEAELNEPLLDLIAEGLRDRTELLETDVDLQNRQISRAAARNALLPSLSLVGYYGGSGLSGLATPGNASALPAGLPTRLDGRISKRLQQFVARLFRRAQLECSVSQPRRQGRSVSFRVGVPASELAQGAIAKADSDRGPQCAICP